MAPAARGLTARGRTLCARRGDDNDSLQGAGQPRGNGSRFARQPHPHPEIQAGGSRGHRDFGVAEDHRFDHCRPGHWTAHVTLGRRFTAREIGDAMAVVNGHGNDLFGTVAGLRRWDSHLRVDHVLVG